jgi:hypothetical protein
MKLRVVSFPGTLTGRVQFLAAAVVKFWHGLISDRGDGYFPERHYMRGPGPKWREKQRSNR